MRWTTDVTVAWINDRLQFSLQLGVASMSFVVRPTWLSIGRPRIVTEILTGCSCHAGASPILPKKQEISVPDVSLFVAQNLLDPKRTLPTVAVSHDRFTDRPVLDVDCMHRTLLGFAQVVVFDKWAAFRLTDSLGKALSCFNGCVRIYWPGLTRTSDPIEHNLYFPSQIERFEHSGRPLDRRLFNHLTKISAFRYAPGDLIREAQSQIASRRLAEAEKARERSQQAYKDLKTLQELQPFYEKALEENSALLKQVKELEEQNTELSNELTSVKSNWALYQEHQNLAADDDTRATRESAELEFQSVEAALAQAEADFARDLLILDSAKTSAGKSEFSRPEEVYRALMAVQDVGNRYFDSVRDRKPMGEWSKQLEERGVTHYSPTESDTVKNDHRKYGKYREFVVNGTKRKIYQHLDLGGGDRKDCLQIYFEADQKLNKVIIAYCGEHLPHPRHRT